MCIIYFHNICIYIYTYAMSIYRQYTEMQWKHIGMLPSSGYQDALHSRNDVKALDPFDVFADSSPTPLVETKRQRNECFFCRECCDSINLGLDGT